ncbi:MAG: hypothetical protein EOO05_06880, partial [Chitinophagaceae bacterium]
MKDHKRYYIISCWLVCQATLCCAQEPDSTSVLDKVTVTGAGKRNSFSGSVPSQTLDRRTLNQLNVLSVGDAAKYFSGVLVKDYGGAGGLKTVSVRSLGASHTGVLYDGIPVSDVQTGQTDLGRYSSNFIQSLDIYQANGTRLPATARSFASASLLSMVSKSFQPSTAAREWFAGLRQGSFGFWQPYAGLSLPAGKQVSVQLNTEFTRSKGNYPLYIENGPLSYAAKRINSGLDSWQGEANVLKVFNDSSTLQVKLFNYASGRGLPGSIALYTQRSNQRLRNDDQFMQARYRKDDHKGLSILIAGKYNYSFTRYTDPDFQNNAGGLDNRYRQREFYFSAAVSKTLGWFTASVASDIEYNTLRSNTANFAFPKRTSLWNNAAVVFNKGLWEITGSTLLTTIMDQTRTGATSADRNKITPSLSVAFRPGSNSPFLLRTFYKEVYRMPTFNDLYYILVGNSNLRPEFARQYNAGAVYSKQSDGAIRSLQFSVDGYVNSIRDKIVAVPGQNLFVWTMLNLGKVNMKGVDLTAEINGKLAKSVTWFARIAYTWQQATDRTDKTAASYGDRIPYTPDHSGSGLLSFTWKRWNAGSSVLFSSSRYS